MTSFKWQYLTHDTEKVSTFLLTHGMSRTLLKKVKFHGGEILINGTSQRANYVLDFGDSIELILPKEPASDSVIVSNLPIHIVYEDANFLVLNKPAGVASVPAHGYSNDTLINRVRGYYQRMHYENQRVHIVTRLDRDTSGLVLFAKNHLASSILDKQLKHHQIKKEYLALVDGMFNLTHGDIYLPIGRDDKSFVKRMVRDDGKISRTEFWVQKKSPHLSLLLVRLHTGRTHQIRVHMEAIHHSLIGDWLYNPTDDRMNRQALHCYRLSFFNPFEQKTINCEAPLPLDFKQTLEQQL